MSVSLVLRARLAVRGMRAPCEALKRSRLKDPYRQNQRVAAMTRGLAGERRGRRAGNPFAGRQRSRATSRRRVPETTQFACRSIRPEPVAGTRLAGAGPAD